MYDRFLELLNERGITAYRVAKDTGLNPTTFTDWKKGKSSPKTDKLQKIADYFDVSLDWLTGNSNFRSVQKAFNPEKENDSYKVFELLLKEHDTTPYKVAKDTGIATATLSDWKNGKYTPKQDKMQKIADYFGVTIDYLMTGKDSTPGETPIDIDHAQNEIERKLLVLCRKANDVSEEEREDIINLFENTIDLYLKAKGIKGDE